MQSTKKPLLIVSDNGSELTSRAILQWQEKHCLGWHYIAPGKPVHNAFAESLNARFHGKSLSQQIARAGVYLMIPNRKERGTGGH